MRLLRPRSNLILFILLRNRDRPKTRFAIRRKNQITEIRSLDFCSERRASVQIPLHLQNPRNPHGTIEQLDIQRIALSPAPGQTDCRIQLHLPNRTPETSRLNFRPGIRRGFEKQLFRNPRIRLNFSFRIRPENRRKTDRRRNKSREKDQKPLPARRNHPPSLTQNRSLRHSANPDPFLHGKLIEENSCKNLSFSTFAFSKNPRAVFQLFPDRPFPASNQIGFW